MISKDVIMQSAIAETGNGTAIDVWGLSQLVMQVSGTFVGTITFEGTGDGSNWVSVQVSNLADGAVSTTATAPGIYARSVGGLTQVRARVSAYTSGSITVAGLAVDIPSGYSLASLPLAVGNVVIGGTKDDGPQWTSTYTYTTSADMQTPADLTAAPTAGQKLVVTDILLSSDTQMLFVFKEETSGTVLGAIRLPADGAAQITPRSAWKLPVADKKLQGDASAAGNVYVTVWYHSEA